ncbi:hypothetical protein HMPREF0491_02850 [Lachnospiraceae oral taxon 107 str. F0167]|nr:lantibiotic ABC transporter permease [uncultured Lachnoanaerobaculum sp.]EGG90119.1 hypothetical protein HMPREF0491_02850 [Lachnospiraceae oral taxon 107 str. F0167]
MDSKERSAYFWNMLGSLVYAITSMLLGVAVTKLAGAYAGGIFFFGFSTLGQQLYIVSYFGMRPIQVTDISNEYTFGDYLRLRAITSFLAALAGFVYIFLTTGDLYVFEVYMILSLYKILDGFCDIFESEMQRQDRLDMTGKATLFRTLLCVGVFLAALVTTKDLKLSSLALLPSILLAAIIFDILPLLRLKPDKTIKKASYISLINKSKWLFLGAFIDLYIFAAAKYAVNYRLGEELNGYFSIIFIPTSIINLMAGFIIRPILTKLSLLYKTGNQKKFISTISKIAAFIFAATVLGMGMAYLLGIPVLKLVLGEVATAIEPYKTALVLVIFGGGLYALVNLGYYCLVIFEMTGIIFLIYAVGAVFAYFVSDFMVIKFGMNGAAMAYMITMLLLTVFFLTAVIFGLRKVKK